jgi:putative hydrolase of HD superfamily
MKKKELKSIANFLYEVGSLAKTPRSFYSFLGYGEQSVSEHMLRCCYIGYSLAKMHGKADPSKVVMMCMFHDFAEARTSDLNYVNQKYVTSDEESALQDMVKEFVYGKDVLKIIDHYKERKSIEAILAKEADNIEFVLSLKEAADIGNARAQSWIPAVLKRFKTKEAKSLVAEILETQSDEWWFVNKESDWWSSRSRKDITKSVPDKK